MGGSNYHGASISDKHATALGDTANILLRGCSALGHVTVLRLGPATEPPTNPHISQ